MLKVNGVLGLSGGAAVPVEALLHSFANSRRAFGKRHISLETQIKRRRPSLTAPWTNPRDLTSLATSVSRDI